MNRIISINIRGLVFQIEEDAFEKLNQYFQKLKVHFRDQNGADEIMDDIETRVAEMLSRDPGLQGIVNMTHVNLIIEQMGDPSQFEQDEMENAQGEEKQQTHTGRRRRMLYRNGDNKVIGGVCSGIAAYLDVDPLLIRIGFLVAFFAFGTSLLLYIILFILIPEAKTPSEKLEMRGEKVTIDNIERSVRDEFDRIKKNFEDPSFRNNTKNAFDHVKRGVGQTANTFVNIVKRLIGLFLVCSVLAVLVFSGLAYFGLLTDLWRTPFFPFFDYLFEVPTYAILFKLSLALLFLIPLSSILFHGVKLLLAIPGKSLWVTRVFGGLWIIALGGTIFLSFQLAGGWRDHATLSKEQYLAPSDTLLIESTNATIYGQQEFVLEFGKRRGIRGIYAIEHDSLKRPVQLNILPSETGQMYLKAHRHSNGKDYAFASELASHIQHTLYVEKGKLIFNPYYGVPTSDVWKNQQLIYDLYVPVGTVVSFGTNTATFLRNVSSDNYIHASHLGGKSFPMTRDGLHVTDKDKTNDFDGRRFHYKGFNELDLNGIPDAFIYYSPEFTITTENGSALDESNFDLEGRRLSISMPESLFGQRNGTVRIGVPSLRRLKVNGSSVVSIDVEQSENIDIELNGASKIEGAVKANNIKIESNGVNTGNLRGSCINLIVQMTGSGDLNLEQLSADLADVEADGGGTLTVYVQKNLKARASGMSIINYRGNPTLSNTKSSGSGKIARIG